MKRVLFILLIILPVYLFPSLYFLDKEYFLCPIKYKGELFIIRNDSRGEGFFAAPRNGNRVHQGIDLLAPIGEPVLAPRSGRIIAATKSNGMGNYVIIAHQGGISTVHGHLSRIFVRKNSFVRQGQVIGAVGKTGNANHPAMHPHLHFEIRKGPEVRDPLEYLG
ncbi:MAG: M23 family metallopeptidase [Candidatus Omnitrophica bacterium]|nr:M23 family metallopeptidase [Candidatus Omnitrophota bacterium]MDD5553780.1 M23 family metallopeptidase [Candidatus Omnitrophota bacterium]